MSDVPHVLAFKIKGKEHLIGPFDSYEEAIAWSWNHMHGVDEGSAAIRPLAAPDVAQALLKDNKPEDWPTAI